MPDLVQKFWESDIVPETKKLLPDDQFRENLFVNTLNRDENGRFFTKLPKRKTIEFKDFRNIAIVCLINSEKNRLKNKKENIFYIRFIDKYLSLGHVEEVPKNELNHPSCYLPHHGV